MIPPEDPNAPKYWMHESSGVLQPVVRKYLRGVALDPNELGIFRAYLRQWVQSPAWDMNPHPSPEWRATLNRLRSQISGVTDMEHLEKWIEDAEEFGVDPL